MAPLASNPVDLTADGPLRSASNEWSYDVTLAVCYATLWFLAELCAARGKRKLTFISTYNYCWSLLTVALWSLAIITVVMEVAFWRPYGVSVPTAFQILATASLTYIIGPVRLSLFDSRAKLLQKVLRADKARFGRPDHRGNEKYFIYWSRWKSGSVTDTWQMSRKGRVHDDAIPLLDWSIDHRIGCLSEKDIWEALIDMEHCFWQMIGELLYYWLPTGSHQYCVFNDRWLKRGRLKGAYRGVKGLRLKLDRKVTFEDWIAAHETSVKHFQLIAVEYTNGTRLVCDKLQEIIRDAKTAEDVAKLLIERWSELIEEEKRIRE